jgi:hypothetical protein
MAKSSFIMAFASINDNFYFINLSSLLLFIIYLLPWKLDPFQNVTISLVFSLDASWELGWFSLGSFHL